MKPPAGLKFTSDVESTSKFRGRDVRQLLAFFNTENVVAGPQKFVIEKLEMEPLNDQFFNQNPVILDAVLILCDRVVLTLCRS